MSYLIRFRLCNVFESRKENAMINAKAPFNRLGLYVVKVEGKEQFDTFLLKACGAGFNLDPDYEWEDNSWIWLNERTSNDSAFITLFDNASIEFSDMSDKVHTLDEFLADLDQLSEKIIF